MEPEALARKNIDHQLEECGWQVQNRDELNIYASNGVAVREFAMPGVGEADYLLYAGGKAIGVVEAKPEDWTLKGVELQSGGYMGGLPGSVPAFHRPLPFGYETTGTVTQFTNALEPEARSREVLAFHRPEELVRLARLKMQVREALQEIPPLVEEGLWPAQVEAIQNLEGSLTQNRPRSLIQMATGSGKTFTAVSAVYRLIRFAGAKRVLFLVDRKNLGTQTLTEFQQYTSPYNGYSFTEEYNIQHLRSNRIDEASRVMVTTVQRLYSMLRDEEEFDEELEESSLFEAGPALEGGPMQITYNPRIPIETFDFIVVDECHRSNYNLWRQVLEYFDASIIGLTATPSKQTIGFFFGNLVMEYPHRRAVTDGVNVEGEVYRIRTRITAGGATLTAEPDFYVPRRDRRTRARRYAELDDDLTYTANQLDRDVVSEQQIRLVIKTFQEKLFTEIFPDRKNVPKTLIFAKDDSHADDITRIVREEFGKGNDFCQKITYRTTGKKPEELLQEFRTAFYPRIAVSVDMIATGTDVKPLECLLFMRNVKSANYLEQMKGRGTRVIDKAALNTVTPDTEAKTHFVIVDAVGVLESDKTESQSLEHLRSVPTEKLLQSVAVGAADPDLASTLASRLSRLDKRISPDQRQELATLASGNAFKEISKSTLREVKAPIPPTNEQYRIVAAIEEQFSRLDAGVVALERVRTNLKRYRTAVLKAAVEGRLTEAWREENPSVEPASDLLERILKERRERWEKDQLAAYEKKGKKPPKNWRLKYKKPAGPNTDDLPELPEGWCWARMEALSQFVTSGSRGWDKYYSDDGATFIRMGNLDHETVTLDLSHVQRVNPPAGAEGTRTRVQPNDILVSITAELGMIALAPDDLDEAYINQHVALARPVNGRTGKYLAWYLASRNGNGQLQSLRRVATKIGLGLDDIRAVNIALPPLAEQEQIVVEIEHRLSILQEVEAEVEANLKRAARLRQAILKRAFEGKLVPQDPTDEPASELLARIRTERERSAPPKRRPGKRPAQGSTSAPQPSLFPGTNT